MTISRRALVSGLCAFTAASLGSRMGFAESYPSAPVRVVVGFPPGGPTDITARLVARWLSDRLGQPFIAENRPGAAGNIGTALVANAAPDGHTLLLAITSNAINATLYRSLPFNFLRDIAPVASIARYPLVMAVNPALAAKSVPEFIALANANPGKLNMASGGIGSIMHMAGELFKMMAQVNLLHVPYRGAAPALTDLVAGRVDVMFDAVQSCIGHIRSGALRPLAVTSAARINALPDVPTVSEFIDGCEVDGWHGIGAPRATPPAIIDRLSAEIGAAVSDPAFRAQLTQAGYVPMATGPAEFAAFIAQETEKWAKVVKFTGSYLD